MDPIIAQAGDKILGLGVLGSFLVILGGAVTVLYRQNQALHLARITDAKEMAKTIEQNTVETRMAAEALRQVQVVLQQSGNNWQTVISEVRTTLAEFLRERRRERP